MTIPLHTAYMQKRIMPRTAHVATNVKNNPYTYYNFAMQPGKGTQEVFNVFQGKSVGFENPYLQGKGHFLDWNFQFFMAGQAEPVAVLKVIDNKVKKVIAFSKQLVSVMLATMIMYE